MSDLLNKKITIDGLDQSNGLKKDGNPWHKFNVVDQDKNKYTFWEHKVDGTSSMAFQTYIEHKLALNSDIGIVYKEEEKSFTNKENKEIKFQERTIVKFEVPPEEGVQVANPTEPIIEQEPPITDKDEEMSNIPF